MAASGPKDEPEVQEQYIQASIITRIIGNVLKRNQHEDPANHPRIHDVALFVQKVILTLDLIQDIDRTSDGYITLPETQKTSIKKLYDFCLNDTSHPEEIDSLQQKIKITMDCLYQNEGNVTNWFNAASYLCGKVRRKLYDVQTISLDDKYLALVETNRARITADTFTRGLASLTSMLKNLSLTESKSADSKIPAPPAPPLPTYMPCMQYRHVESRSSEEISRVTQTSMALSMDEILEKREALAKERGSKSIEDRLKEARESKQKQKPRTMSDLLTQNSKFMSLSGMSGGSGSSVGRVVDDEQMSDDSEPTAAKRTKP